MKLDDPLSWVAAAFNSLDRMRYVEVQMSKDATKGSYQFEILKLEDSGIFGPVVSATVHFEGLIVTRLRLEFEPIMPPGQQWLARNNRGDFQTFWSFTLPLLPDLPLPAISDNYFRAIPDLAAGFYKLGLCRDQIWNLDLFTGHEKMVWLHWLNDVGITVFKEDNRESGTSSVESV